MTISDPPARLRVAIIGCGPVDQEPMTYMGSKWTIRRLLAAKVQELASQRNRVIEARCYWPASIHDDYPEEGSYDAVIIPGSKLNIDDKGREQNPWMEDLLDFISDIDEDVPVLGICFGHQAVAVANGGRVEKIPEPLNVELGFSRIHMTREARHDPILGRLPPDFEGLFSHFTYVSRAPKKSRVLARGVIFRRMIQAYRIGKSMWGVQFHPDLSEDNITEVVGLRKSYLEGMTDLSKIKTQIRERHDHEVLSNFMEYAFETTSQGVY